MRAPGRTPRAARRRCTNCNQRTRHGFVTVDGFVCHSCNIPQADDADHDEEHAVAVLHDGPSKTMEAISRLMEMHPIPYTAADLVDKITKAKARTIRKALEALVDLGHVHTDDTDEHPTFQLITPYRQKEAA